MDKRYIKDLEGYMAIPDVTKILGLSRARIHQLIDEDKFDLEDLRVVGDKRMVIIKNAAVYAYLHTQEDRIETAQINRQEKDARQEVRIARAAVLAQARAEQAGRVDEEFEEDVPVGVTVEAFTEHSGVAEDLPPVSGWDEPLTQEAAEKLARERAASMSIDELLADNIPKPGSPGPVDSSKLLQL